MPERAGGRHIRAIENDAAFLGRDQTRNGFEQRRLSGAVRTDD
jgi:hypothetical protein